MCGLELQKSDIWDSLLQMYSTLLSVMFLGLWSPQSQVHTESVLAQLTVAPPAQQIDVQSHLSASGVLVLDMDSGQALYNKHIDVQRPMASITKIMTALLIVENHDLNEIVRIPHGIDVAGNKAYFTPGEQFTLGDVLSALLISSANDAGEVLAIYHSGSRSAFVVEMNERAAQLGLYGTSYGNPTGLDHPGQFSTPRDIAWLTTFALKHPAIAVRMSRRWDRIVSFQGTDISLSNTHALIHDAQGPVSAGKTGTTTKAGQCLVSVVEHGRKRYLMVLLNSASRYKDMSILLETVDPNLV